MHSLARHFLAIDPGATTGFAALHAHANREPTFTLSQYDTRSPGSAGFVALASTLRRYSAAPGTIVTIEDFQIRASANAKGANRNWGLQPVAITGALQGFLAAYELPTDQWIYQTASLAMSSFPDARLQQVCPVWFDYTVGYPHARDAARHLLTYLKQRQPALFQAAKAATPHVGKPLQTPAKRARRSPAC